MTRKNARAIAVKLLYSSDFQKDDSAELVNDFFSDEHYITLLEEEEVFASKPSNSQIDYIQSLVSKTADNITEIDSIISRFSSGRRIERISRTALAVLRCAVCEMLYFKDIPVSVSINEAVEISKQYDSQDTVAFINGILGSAAREIINDAIK